MHADHVTTARRLTSLVVAGAVVAVLAGCSSTTASHGPASPPVESSPPAHAAPVLDAASAHVGDGMCTDSFAHYGYTLAPVTAALQPSFAGHTGSQALHLFVAQLPGAVQQDRGISRGAYAALASSNLGAKNPMGITSSTPVWVVEQSGLDQAGFSHGGPNAAEPVYRYSVALESADARTILLTQLC